MQTITEETKAARLKLLVEMVKLERCGNEIMPLDLLKIELGGIKGSRAGIIRYAKERIEQLEG